jgi:hypothetical protein
VGMGVAAFVLEVKRRTLLQCPRLCKQTLSSARDLSLDKDFFI